MDRLGGGPGDGYRNLLIGFEQGLVLRQDVPDRRLGSRAQIARPDLGRHPADMFVRIAARQPRERLVYPVQAQVRTEESKADGGLAEQRGEQRGV